VTSQLKFIGVRGVITSKQGKSILHFSLAQKASSKF